MTATEELRRLLDERGVEYTQTIVMKGVLFTIVTSKEYYFILVRDNDAGIEMWSQYFTPEQAIAATLGRGMLTADDVRDLIERHSDASGGNGRDFHNGAYVAIADELNATLGPGTCHADETETIYASRYDANGWTNYHIHVMECCACGRTYEHVWGNYEYCPHCGRRIKEDDE